MTVWGAELAVLAFAAIHAIRLLASVDFSDDVDFSAPRLSSLAAPENTLAAIRKAIADGADYVEIHVRETADRVPVLLHDRDLRRVGGDDRHIWQVRSAALAVIDAGSRFSSDFLPASQSPPSRRQSADMPQLACRLTASSPEPAR